MEIRIAEASEVAALTLFSKNAFDSDIEVGAVEAGGPPDYDSEKWHTKMMKSKNLHTILADGKIVGGILLFTDKREPDVMYVGRIFIDTMQHRKGYGREAMLYIEKMFPEIKFYRLETPVWNTRTNTFYPSLGYIEMKRDAESIYYQKQINK